MGNSNFIQSSIAAAAHDWRRQFHRGWVDAQNGVKWPADYEIMNKSEQIAYEQGRLLCREALAEGFELVVWLGDKAGAGAVDELWNEVCAKLGRRVTPEAWLPDGAA
jgi:hypothetical protein